MRAPDSQHAKGAGTDAQAFIERFWDCAPSVHAYLSRRAGRQVADDLFGEVWLHAFKARASYEQRGPDPRPWLYGIARNMLRAHWRRRGRPLAELADVAFDPWDDADLRLEAQSTQADLRRALELLTDAEREVLLLVAWEHLTPAEAANVLGIPQGTARSRLHRARHVLRHEVPSPFVTSVCTIPKESAP
jgi:RNA polymerase sigma factor (sigma-70 family)